MRRLNLTDSRGGLLTFIITLALVSTRSFIEPEASPAEIPANPPLGPTKSRTAYNALPRGNQIFNGVSFRIQGPINVIGARAAKAKGTEFARIPSFPVRGRGKHIHVLHTGDHGSSPPGNFIWRLVLRYADGETRRFDFAYGVHIRNFWRRPTDREAAPNDPDSSIVWVGTSQESDRSGAELVVSRTTVANPRPNIDVVGADLVSLLGQSSAYVFAVTVSDDGPKPAAKELISAPNVPPFTFVFQGPDGKPEPNVTLDCVFECSGFSVRLAQTRAGADGRVTIDVPTDVVSLFRYDARDASGNFEQAEVEISPGDKSWKPHIVRFK